MKAIVYRPTALKGSWRPRSLVDMRGPNFPKDYYEFAVLEACGIDAAIEQYSSCTGDVIFLGEGDDLMAYAVGPMGIEMVKFGETWESP